MKLLNRTKNLDNLYLLLTVERQEVLGEKKCKLNVKEITVLILIIVELCFYK